jgi:hypothetical protein
MQYITHEKQPGLNDIVLFFDVNHAHQTTSSLSIIKAESLEPAVTVKMLFIPSHQCWSSLFVGQNNEIESKQYCEKEIDINDYIATLTTTDKGRMLWEKASAKFEDELWGKVTSGEISKIKYYRIIKNIDQKTLSKSTGLLQPNISRIEKPGAKPSIANYKKIAKALDIDYKELLP